MKNNGISFILNNQFLIRYCTARQGDDTPLSFYCRRGQRKWSRFFYLNRGKTEFFSKTGKKICAEAGDVVFLPYDVEYQSGWTETENGHYYCVEFILEYSDGTILNLFDDLTLMFRDNGCFKALFGELVKTMEEGTVGFQLQLQARFMQLLYQLAIHMQQSDARLEDIMPAVSVIEGDFFGELDVDELAEKCHLSPATLRRRFLKYFGMSPVKYRNFLRLRKARELLSTGLYTVGEAAQIVGIPDACYFNKLYKKQFGKNPSEDLEKFGD